jgi:transcriptional regulator with XRE-family HTH domain
MKSFDEVGWLKKFKKESGWTFEELAAEIGLHPITIKKWFAGDTKPSKLARKVLIAFMIDYM